MVDEYLKEKRIDGENDIRLYNSILYHGFSLDFPNESKKYYNIADADADEQWNNWGKDLEDCYIRKYNTSYYRDREDYFARNNYRIIRYADILLNYAECIVETNGTVAEAAKYVDQVRDRVGLAKLKDSRWAACLNSKDAFLKRLQMERTLELCFEGWRWADLKRWGMLDTQEGINELKSRDADFNNFVIGKHRRLPIPQYEIDQSDGQLTQNPMYYYLFPSPFGDGNTLNLKIIWKHIINGFFYYFVLCACTFQHKRYKIQYCRELLMLVL